MLIVYGRYFWRRWHCEACGRNPHANPRTRPIFTWMGILLLAPVGLAGWAMSPNEGLADAVLVWSMRIGGPAALAWAVFATVRGAAPVRLEDELRAVE